MAVVIETTLGDIIVDLFTEERPLTCLNFLKLCKIKYYNLCLFHSVQHNFLAQTGDPTGSGKNGESVFGKIHGGGSRFYEAEVIPKLRHTKPGLLSMVNCGNNMLGSQFFITLGSELQSLDSEHCVFGEVAEGNEVLLKLNEVICDSEHRPYQDIRITHTVILDDPFDDPHGLQVPDCSPEPSPAAMMNGRIAPDEELDETQGLSAAEIEERERSREAHAQATILEIVGDLPDADMAPPENVLFVCKLNPVTSDDDLEIIFSRFGKVKSCEVIRDKITGDSLQYAFVEFEDRKSCEDAYFKMDNVLIDDRRIHVDFSQSVARLHWKGKGRGVEHISEKAEMKQDKSGTKHDRSHHEHRGSLDRVATCEVENQQQNHAYDKNSRGHEFGRDKNSTFKKSRRHDGDYNHDSRQQERRDKKAARNEKDKTVSSGNDDRSRHNYERSKEVDKTKHEEHKRHAGVDKDASCSHSNDESRRFKDVKVKSEQRCRKIEDRKGKTHRDSDKHKCEESRNRQVSDEDERYREADKDVRNDEERRHKNVDRNVTVKHRDGEDKRLATQGVQKCKDAKERERGTVKEKSDREVRGEAKKRRHSSSLAQSRKKHKRSPSSDSESSSSSDLTSSTTSSSTESSGERSKARHKKHHKRPTVLARKSKKKLKLSKKRLRRLRKDSDTESLSSDSSDSGSRSRNRNKKKRKWKGESSEEDSNSEHEVKKKKKNKNKKKKKVTTKRNRKSSSSEDSESDDTSSDSEDQKPSRKHHKKVIKKSKKNHMKKKKRKKKKSVQKSESDESSCGNRKVCSSPSD